MPGRISAVVLHTHTRSHVRTRDEHTSQYGTDFISSDSSKKKNLNTERIQLFLKLEIQGVI